MTHHQGPVPEELCQGAPGYGDLVPGHRVVHQEHGHHVVEEVGNRYVEKAVNRVNLYPHKVSLTLSDHKPSEKTGAY